MNAITGTVMNDRTLTGESLGVLLSATGDAGHTSVPLKPTAAMLASGARAGGVSVEAAWKIYQAMIKAER